MQKVYDATLKSRYGYIWRGIMRPHDREMGIAGSEVVILELETNEVLGVHRGYAQFDIDKTVAGTAAMQWWRRCPLPSRKAIPLRQEFILKVLKPAGSSLGDQGGSNATK